MSKKQETIDLLDNIKNLVEEHGLSDSVSNLINNIDIALEAIKDNLYPELTKKLLDGTKIDKDIPSSIIKLSIKSKYLDKVLSLKKGFYINNNNRTLRKLSSGEMYKSKDYLEYDFNIKKLVPIFDIMDNDFLCFDIAKNKYCCFNMIDEVSFDEQTDLFKLIESLA